MSDDPLEGFVWQPIGKFNPSTYDFVILRNESGWCFGGQHEGRRVEIVDGEDYLLTIGEPTEFAVVPDDRINDFDFG